MVPMFITPAPGLKGPVSFHGGSGAQARGTGLESAISFAWVSWRYACELVDLSRGYRAGGVAVLILLRPRLVALLGGSVVLDLFGLAGRRSAWSRPLTLRRRRVSSGR